MEGSKAANEETSFADSFPFEDETRGKGFSEDGGEGRNGGGSGGGGEGQTLVEGGGEDSDRGGGNLKGTMGVEDGIDESLIIQELYHKVKKSKLHTDNYLGLFGFIMLTSLYLAILYLQADSFRTYQVSTAHLGLLPDGADGTGGFVFSSTSEVFEWINNSIIQEIWQDASCGNGICERPDEYMAFGRFGCLSDCGANPNVSEIVMTISNDFSSEEAMMAASWNLCMTYPKDDLCWFEEDVTFSKLIYVNVTPASVPDGNWTLTVNAPLGGVVGSIFYNGTYLWETEDKLEMGDSLVSWGNCAPNRTETELGECRQTAAFIVGCAEKYCLVNNQSISSPASKSAIFVDMVAKCDFDFGALEDFKDLTCEQIAVNLTLNSTGDFNSLTCDVTSRRRLLQNTSPSPWLLPSTNPSGIVSRRLLQGDGSPTLYSELLWAVFGASDVQRFAHLQAATQRAIFSWVRDSCLASLPISVKPANTARLSSFFCTYLGGPVSLEGCSYVNGSGVTLYSDQDLYLEMQVAHARMNITAQQQVKFIELFVWAFQSVITFDVSTLIVLRRRLHQLDPVIVDTVKSGCPYVAQVLPWMRGRNYLTEVEVGQSITWVWEDDQPHALRAEGFGDDENAFFQGMGAGRMVVSRSTLCSKDNLGATNVSTYPQPCTLVNPDAAVNVFTYTKYFKEAGNFSYVDSYDASSTGTVVVKPSDGLVDDDQSTGNLAQLCAPGCAWGMLKNGKCNSLCNNVDCAYDGGDCSCAPNEFGIEVCECPEGQTMASDGTCCASYGVGNNLKFDFQLASFGPNVTISDANFLPKGGPPLFRYVSVVNRLLIGMSLTQTRWASSACKDGRFLDLFPNCTYGSSSASYGVNPVFLPTSQLYDAYFEKNDTLYYQNYSLGYKNSTLRNKQGVPYGFDSFSRKGSKPTFHYIFDINYNNLEATESLQYLIDGFFLDNATKELTVDLVTYNGIAHYFTLFKVLLTFQIGGKVALSYDVQSVTAEPYRRDVDKFRMALEIIFALLVIWNLIEEIKEMINSKRIHGTYISHFQRLWNILDFISLSIMVAGICLWIHYVVTQARPFDISLRYEIYDIVSWMDPGLFWDIVPPGKGFADALNAYKRVESMVYFRTYYIAIQGINVLLMVLRILKLMDFQPRMGTITRTLAAAMQDLLHFFILFFIVFVGFAMYGHLVFGRTIREFRSLGISFNTCFTALLGDDTVNAYLMELKGWELAAGVLFWWAFIILMVFIILNLLIGIIVDAFVKVRDAAEDAPSMPAEVLFILKSLSTRLFTPVPTDRQLLQQLRALGADKQQDLRKYAEHYGIYLPPQKGVVVTSEEERERQVLKVSGLEIDGPTLEAILERASMRQADPSYKLKKKVDPKLVADVIFNQYRSNATQMDMEEEEEEMTAADKMVNDMETMKRDMAELKEMVRNLAQSTLQR